MQGHEPLFDHVLVTVKPAQELVLGPWAFALARASGGKVTLLTVFEDPEAPEARGFAAKLRQAGEASGVPYEVVVRYGDPAHEILAAARSSAADVILLSRREDSPRAGVIEKTLCKARGPGSAPFPVMVIPVLDHTRRVATRPSEPSVEPFSAATLAARTAEARARGEGRSPTEGAHPLTGLGVP